ncbi:MAG: DUF4340 domain-containing protein [Desulfosoma sp.]
MKWRHSIIYLLVLIVLGGYYYWFEVVKKREKDEAERVKNKLYTVKAENVEELFLEAEGKPRVHLVKKDGTWVLEEPLDTEADQGAVDTLVHVLVELEKSREVDTAAKDVALYGLAAPHLTVRFRSADTWHRLRFGSQNPSGESRYAVKEDENAVFLVAAGQVQGLSKTPEDLRRRDLLTFDDDNIEGLKVSWADGRRVELVREEKNKETWRCVEEPERRVKNTKVENVLNQLRWLRAKTFLDSAGQEAPWQGEAFEVQVILRGFDGSEQSIQLGRKKDQPETYVALSSQLKTPVTVDASIFKELPKTVRDVEDRSLVALNSKDVTRVEYNVGEEKGELILEDGGTWVQVKADGTRRRFKESWRVRPLFWEWEDLEYEEKVPTEEACGQSQDMNRMAFFQKDKGLGVLTWLQRQPNDKDDTLPLCVDSGTAFLVKAEKIKEIERKFREVLKSP